MEDTTSGQWDLFISHASEDKEAFVAPLAAALARFGITVWYDEYELKLGDSLSRAIDTGLAKSDYGLVVLSKNFFAKGWPERELSGLVSREMMGRKIILPIWHQVTFQEVVSYSPPLADKIAIRSDSMSVVELAVKIIERIRPDLFTHIQRRLAHVKALRNSRISSIDPKKIKIPPIRHPVLSDELVSRIRLVRASLLGVNTHSMSFWLSGFQRDSHPSQEVAYWEHVAAVYHEYVSMTPEIRTAKEHEAVFNYINTLWIGDAKALAQFSSKLPKDAPEKIGELYNGKLPVYDIKEDPDEDLMRDEKQENPDAEDVDLEHFPRDLPNDLISELINCEERK